MSRQYLQKVACWKFINSQYLQPSQTTSADSFYLKFYRYNPAAISYNQKESPCKNTVWLLRYVHLTRYYAWPGTWLRTVVVIFKRPPLMPCTGTCTTTPIHPSTTATAAQDHQNVHSTRTLTRPIMTWSVMLQFPTFEEVRKMAPWAHWPKKHDHRLHYRPKEKYWAYLKHSKDWSQTHLEWLSNEKRKPGQPK